MKKHGDSSDQPAPRRGPGRPPGSRPAKSSKERQEAFRAKLKAEGRKMLHLSLPPETIEQFDAMRVGDESREDAFERLVSAAPRRRR